MQEVIIVLHAASQAKLDNTKYNKQLSLSSSNTRISIDTSVPNDKSFITFTKLDGCEILKTSAPQYLSTQLRFDNQRNDLIKSVIGFFNLINIVYACTKHIESTFSFIPSQENVDGDFLRCEDCRMRAVQAWPHRGLYKQTIFCLQILAAQSNIQTNNIQHAILLIFWGEWSWG